MKGLKEKNLLPPENDMQIAQASCKTCRKKRLFNPNSTAVPIPVPTANHHSVKGSKGDTYKVVDLNDGTDIWTCTCPAYTYHKVPGTDCKHIKEAKTKLATA
jgi:hypothetical protein